MTNKYDLSKIHQDELRSQSNWKYILNKFCGGFKNKVILDVGCGAGQLSRELSISSKLSIGLEFRKFDTCIPTSKWEFIIADAHRLPFKDETFDLITGVGLLEHVRCYKIVIEEMMRTLKPGGYLFFTGGPNGNIWKYFDKPAHIAQVYHHPTPRELCSCLRNGNLKKVWAHNVYYRLAKQADFVLGRNLPKPLQLIINLKFFRYLTIGIAYCLEQLNLEEIVDIVYQKSLESRDEINGKKNLQKIVNILRKGLK